MARPKKTVTLFEAKPLNEPITPLFQESIEDYEVFIEPPNGLPKTNEAIKSTKKVPGGILWMGYAFKGDPSFLDPKVDKIALCLSIIKELDKGNKGYFNNAYFMNCDKLTPTLQQFEFFKNQFNKLWKEKDPPTEEIYMLQFGAHMRLYLRAMAFRFFSYYHMGYSIIFKKMEVKEPVKQEEKVGTAAN